MVKPSENFIDFVNYMLIEQILPKVVAGKAKLQGLLAMEGQEKGLSTEEIEAFIAVTPQNLLSANCFLDRITGLWRYEFGLPYKIGSRFLLGTHMWPPVKQLFAVIRCAHDRLNSQQLKRYLERLIDLEKHMDTLVEFLPILRLAKDVAVDFEVKTGVGGHNVDWRISNSTGRPILIDVKRRMRDLLEAMDKLKAGELNSEGTIPPPIHNVSLLFRSIEEKYASVDPQLQLQGAWIMTALKQEEAELTAAFNALDRSRVHFAILGDWESGIKLLTRREDDLRFLINLFQEEVSDRYHFSRVHGG